MQALEVKRLHGLREENPLSDKGAQVSQEQSQRGRKNSLIENINNCMKQGKENIAKNPKTTSQDMNHTGLWSSICTSLKTFKNVLAMRYSSQDLKFIFQKRYLIFHYLYNWGAVYFTGGLKPTAPAHGRIQTQVREGSPPSLHRWSALGCPCTLTCGTAGMPCLTQRSVKSKHKPGSISTCPLAFPACTFHLFCKLGGGCFLCL